MIKISSIGSFFEEHVEKIILVIVGLVCAWLLITRVIFSPNLVEYNKSKFSPSALDSEILKEAKVLEQTLRDPPEKLEPYKPRVGEFLALLDSSIRGIDIRQWAVAPREAGSEDAVGVYSLPRIGEVNAVAVEHIRVVAYVPIGEVTEENPYDKAGNEPNDVDLVTVAAKFDIAGLYDRFKESFVEYVEERWADPCLARPIFAGVQLQRQERNGDGSWGEWQDVPRTKIDQYRKLFEVVENVEELPAGGLKVRLLQYDYQPVQIGLLQPEPYQLASADEEWLPPELHKEYAALKAKETLEEKRQAREDEREERQRDDTSGRTGGRRPQGVRARGANRGVGGDAASGNPDYAMGTGDTRTSRGGRTRSSRGRTGTGLADNSRGRSTGRGSRGRTPAGPMDDMLYDRGMGSGVGGRSQRFSPINEVYNKYDEIMLTRLTEFEKLDDLTFWAHDDTVEPRKAYRYRIRLGIFNPIAGTDKISEKNKSQRDDVVLWSNYSGTTEPVEIMGKLYFFANSMRETDKTVTVQVSRLALGRWHNHDFLVRHGEVIGDAIEPEPEEPDRQRRSSDPGGRFAASLARPGLARPGLARPGQANVPELIDYRTGAVIVDAVPVNDWSPRAPLRTRHYYDMLYSYDGINIEHMPVGVTYRPPELATVHSHIARLQKEPQEDFKSFGTSGRRQGRGDYGDMMDEYGDEYYMDETYMDQTGGGAGRRR